VPGHQGWARVKSPWFKFFPGDWRQCPELRLCSLEARGLWMEILCLCAQSPSVGRLVIRDRAPSEEQIAALVGRPVAEVARGLHELRDYGVFDEINGVITSRKMVRDARISQMRSELGSEGGRASVQAKAQAKAQANGQANGQPQSQKSESEVRDQNQSQIPPTPQGGKPARKPRRQFDLETTIAGTCLDTPGFREAWSSWVFAHGQYKTDSQVKRVMAWGEERAVAAIRYSLAQEFAGIYEDKNGGGLNGTRQYGFETAFEANKREMEAEWRARGVIVNQEPRKALST